MGTAMKGPQAEARPMTSNRAANFGQQGKQDPFYQTKTKIDLTKKLDGGPEE
jgi:intraflagellar transport protein 88